MLGTRRRVQPIVRQSHAHMRRPLHGRGIAFSSVSQSCNRLADWMLINEVANFTKVAVTAFGTIGHRAITPNCFLQGNTTRRTFFHGAIFAISPISISEVLRKCNCHSSPQLASRSWKKNLRLSHVFLTGKNITRAISVSHYLTPCKEAMPLK